MKIKNRFYYLIWFADMVKSATNFTILWYIFSMFSWFLLITLLQSCVRVYVCVCKLRSECNMHTSDLEVVWQHLPVSTLSLFSLHPQQSFCFHILSHRTSFQVTHIVTFLCTNMSKERPVLDWWVLWFATFGIYFLLILSPSFCRFTLYFYV